MLTPASSATSASRASPSPCRQITATVASRIRSRRSFAIGQQYRIIGIRVKDDAFGWVEGHAGELSDWTRTIWELAEPAWREYRSAAWYVERLGAEGFSVEEASGGM